MQQQLRSSCYAASHHVTNLPLAIVIHRCPLHVLAPQRQGIKAALSLLRSSGADRQ